MHSHKKEKCTDTPLQSWFLWLEDHQKQVKQPLWLLLAYQTSEQSQIWWPWWQICSSCWVLSCVGASSVQVYSQEWWQPHTPCRWKSWGQNEHKTQGFPTQHPLWVFHLIKDVTHCMGLYIRAHTFIGGALLLTCCGHSDLHCLATRGCCYLNVVFFIWTSEAWIYHLVPFDILISRNPLSGAWSLSSSSMSIVIVM